MDETNGNNIMGSPASHSPISNNSIDDDSLSERCPDILILHAEFLTSIMKKDYRSALKYCNLSEYFIYSVGCWM